MKIKRILDYQLAETLLAVDWQEKVIKTIDRFVIPARPEHVHFVQCKRNEGLVQNLKLKRGILRKSC